MTLLTGKQLFSVSRTRLLLTCGAVFCAGQTAFACPMCKQAAESDPNLPAAFQASILLMLTMPALLLSGFSFAFWRLSKQMPTAEGSQPRDGYTGEVAVQSPTSG